MPVRELEHGTDALRRISNRIADSAAEFLDTQEQMYSFINEDIRNVWRGEVCELFMCRLQNAEPKFKQMYKLLMKYSHYLVRTADEYDQQQEDVTAVIPQIEH